MEYGESFETAVAREVGEEYSTRPLTIETIGARNVLREVPASHWVAVIFAVRIDPAEAAIGEPHKFDELGWFSPDSLHSQLAESIRLFRAWQGV
ncbi:NUDIX domain-containing protein [Amycolatopsis sp. NPDC058278]|uniref:NUDIX domain-containing protein n=1 Tax=Amycolatopsis sp. NPDC058278 TaxID=3346417 RepID=UPI0036DE9211